ncbi:unnamed protein product, partial [Polarella glacialis]
MSLEGVGAISNVPPLDSEQVGAASAGEADAASASRAWAGIFNLFHKNGMPDRGTAYALGLGSLRRKIQELDDELEAVSHSESVLLEFARREAKKARTSGADGPPSLSDESLRWGEALARAVSLE